MSEFTTIMARDGHEFRAWLAAPPGAARGAVVIVQEIFGVNSHIRAVTDGYAAEGYVAIAPSLFDRVRKGIELGYTQPEVQEGFGYAQQLKPEQTLQDLGAALAVVKHAGRVGMVGYCWGGKLTYMAACDLPIACGVAYYGGSTTQCLDKKPKCPMMYHFGAEDTHIPMSDVEKIKAANPQGIFHIYQGAGHGFNCDQRASYNPQAAALALARSVAFFAQHLRQPRAA
ncbi:MAG TPA: dienelactone hydrolase family protein [Steroidobacteraceae bacterium]|jgi:carboxymethylenebutenolidase|nr:dienelactone hydrolase family protein [Steroidobacteraceae bacterium]